MFHQDEVEPEAHAAWFEAASHDPDKHLMIVESTSSGPIGFVQFKMIRGGPVCDWGFYVVPGSPRGSGRRLGHVAIRYAFGELGVHKICGQAIAYNDASRSFHEAMGFEQEGRLRDQYFDGSRYHDVVCFGLLKTDWTDRQ